ncbi:High mobility group superfamily [Penicillium sp. DV-2018c]|nr:High mobility group superfamily [Penicillium sp. DV-2018c]KAJ5566348.1 High mobility group superfamily [Penicillium sp. DV-2018c]
MRFSSTGTPVADDMPPRRALEILWCEAMQNIDATDGEVLVPGNIVDNVLGMDNLKEMRNRLANMNNGWAHMLYDESLGAWRLSIKYKNLNEKSPAQEIADNEMPIDEDDHRLISQSIHRAAALETAPDAPAASAASSPKVPRPPNCFILYRKAHHHIVKEANPGLSNNEISRILGDRWNNERPEVRARYTRLAETLKREHAIKHPDYQYAPRRPSERKRRATRVTAKTIGYVDQDPIFQSALSRSQFIGEEQYIPIDDKLLNMLDDKGLLYGPNGVAPEPDSYSQSDLISIANDLISGNDLATFNGTFDMNFDSQGQLLPNMF